MSLSIIIVNYKTPALLVNCLRSIYDQSSSGEFEIIIVDNASNDNSREIITHEFNAVSWIQMDYNSGFARANNEGIRRSKGDVILLLNSDTINIENAIEKTYVDFINSKFVACGVQLLNEDGTPQISGSRFMPGSLNNLLPLPYIGYLIKLLGRLFQIKKPHFDSTDSVFEADWINGAFLMVKKDVLSLSGLLDEDFFLYAEEAEWCYRIGKFGKMAIYGNNKVLHLQGESANETFNSSGKGYYNLYDKKGLQIMLSNFLRIRKQYGKSWFLFHLLAYTFTIPIYFILELIKCIITLNKNTVVRLNKVFAYSSNVFQIWGFLGKILPNSPFFYKVL